MICTVDMRFWGLILACEIGCSTAVSDDWKIADLTANFSRRYNSTFSRHSIAFATTIPNISHSSSSRDHDPFPKSQSAEAAVSVQGIILFCFLFGFNSPGGSVRDKPLI